MLWVWKTIADQFAGRITLFRVISGVLKSDTTVQNLTREAPERFGHVLVLQGKTQTHVPELHAGDLGAVAKLKDTHTNDTLGDRHAAFTVPPITFPEPVLAYAIEPKSRGDEDKIGTGDAAAARGRPVDRLHARSADARAAARRARASCTSKSRSPSCGGGSASRST